MIDSTIQPSRLMMSRDASASVIEWATVNTVTIFKIFQKAPPKPLTGTQLFLDATVGTSSVLSSAGGTSVSRLSKTDANKSVTKNKI